MSVPDDSRHAGRKCEWVGLLVSTGESNMLSACIIEGTDDTLLAQSFFQFLVQCNRAQPHQGAILYLLNLLRKEATMTTFQDLVVVVPI